MTFSIMYFYDDSEDTHTTNSLNRYLHDITSVMDSASEYTDLYIVLFWKQNYVSTIWNRFWFENSLI